MDEITHPADCVVHWATGPVPACREHAQQLVGLGRFMGAHVPVTALTEPANCGNCVNEQRSNRDG